MRNSRFPIVLLAFGLLLGCAAETKKTDQSLPDSWQVDATGQFNTETALAATAKQSEEEDKNKVYCTMVKPTGSRIPKKYCRTRADDEKNREIARNWVNQARVAPRQGIDGG